MDQIRHDITGKMIRLSRLHRKVCEQRVEKTGVHHSQHRMLMNFAHRNLNSQVELAECMNVSPATIAVTMKKLEKNGYISRTVNEKDNRFNCINITEKGHEVIEKSHMIFDSLEQKLYEGFTEEELNVLSDFYERLYENLENIQKEG